MLGFGCSGRPDFNSHTFDEVMAFFNWQLRSWMDKTGYDSKYNGQYTMFCHSLGCYFASYWALDNLPKINQLIFMSPCGMQGVPDGFTKEDFIGEI